MKIVATVEARMASSRLPGKVMLEAAGKPMLEHLITRLLTVSLIDEIVLATTVNPLDDELEIFAKKIGISCFRGSESDVMSRVILAAESASADIVVEITGDCPIIDPQLIDQAIRIFNSNKMNYVNNCHIRSYPDGMDVQVFTLDTLKRSAEMTVDFLDREHVTLHIRKNPDIFSHLNLVSPAETFWPSLGLTLDEPKDYDLLKKVIENFHPNNLNFSCKDVIEFLKKNPDFVLINKNVIRKGNT